MQLRDAGLRAHPMVPSVSRGVAGYVDDVEFRGGQSLDLDGNDATGRLRASWWCLRVPRGAVRMKTCSDATCVGSSHGGDMAGGWELTAPVVSAAEEENRRRG